MIGIICAMDEEIICLKRKMHVTNEREIAGMQFFLGTVDEQEVVVVRCGMGKVDAAICTQILVDRFDVKYVIDTGVAGGLHPSLEIGDLIVASDINNKLVQYAEEAAEGLSKNNKVYVGKVSSEDQFICSMRLKEDVYTTFTAYCAEMESAAIAHTCFLNNVPFVMIRVISDKADQSADINFEDFVDIAAKTSSGIIERVLNKCKEME